MSNPSGHYATAEMARRETEAKLSQGMSMTFRSRGWTTEATRAVNFLARMPGGSTTLGLDDTHALLMETGGNMLACGRLYDIVAHPIGAGVFKITLKLTHP